MRLNRTEIRATRKAYLTARAQHESILKDQGIQSLFEAGADTEANYLIDQRYPLGRWEKVREYGLAMITAMYRKSPVKVEPELLWANPQLFAQALDLAGRV